MKLTPEGKIEVSEEELIEAVELYNEALTTLKDEDDKYSDTACLIFALMQVMQYTADSLNEKIDKSKLH